MNRKTAGVSSVIGVILTVLITLIMATVVYTLITGSVVKPANFYLSRLFLAEATGDGFIVTFHGGIGAGELTKIKIIVNGEEFVNLTSKPSIGDTWIFKSGQLPKGPGALPKIFIPNYGKNDDHLVIVGVFEDEYSVVIVDTFV